MTNYLRFPDEATGMVALYNAGLLDSYTSEVITASHSHALDVIGEIPETTGWHVNYVGDVPEGWEQYAVSPEQPVRVFF